MVLISDMMQLSQAQQYIQKILEKPGYSIARIAKELNVPASTVANLYKGRAKKPNSKLFKRLFALYLYVVIHQAAMGEQTVECEYAEMD